MGNSTAADIKNGFAALGGGIKEAGRKRVFELVAKQGYVEFRTKEAADLFLKDPNYKGWKCFVEQGEYRFYPPENVKAMEEQNVQDDPKIFETYKEKTQDVGYVYSVFVDPLSDGKFEYRLVAQNKMGERKEIQKVQIELDGKFLREVVPSMYYYMSGKIPGIDYKKGDELMGFNFTLDNYDGTRRMAFGGLSKEQLAILEEMKAYIDEKYMHVPAMTGNVHK